MAAKSQVDAEALTKTKDPFSPYKRTPKKY